MPVPEIGKFGVIKDVSSHLLPPGAWSEGRNIRFDNQRILRTKGTRKVYGDVSVEPYWGIYIEEGGDVYWLYSSLDKMYSVTQDTSSLVITHTELATGLNVDQNRLWNGGNLSGQIVINNGVDAPKKWTAGAATLGDLNNWPSDLRAKVLRPFGYFLVAFNLTEGTNDYGNRVRWSNPAVPGELPSSWATDDATVEAGQVDLSDEVSGQIVDAVTLGDNMIIYKNNSTHVMRYVGGQNVFAFSKTLPDRGALATGCVSAFSHSRGQYHCVFTGDDIIAHDGRTVQHTLDGRVTRYISSELSSSTWQRSFVVNLPYVKENWICYPTQESSSPNKAAVWNYRDDSVSFVDLPENTHWIAQGIAEVLTDVTWDEITTTWDETNRIWDIGDSGQGNLRPVQFRVGNENSRGLFRMDLDVSEDEIEYRLERANFAYVPDARTLQPIFDPGSEKTLRGVRLHFRDDKSHELVDVEIRGKNKLFGEGTIIQSKLNRKRSHAKFDCKGATFRALDIVIKSRDTEESKKHQWELLGMELDIEPRNPRYGGGAHHVVIRNPRQVGGLGELRTSPRRS